MSALGACGDKAASTLLIAEINSDLNVANQMDEIRLLVQRPNNKGSRELKFSLTDRKMLPVTAGLLPASDGDMEELTLIARAYKSNGQLVQTEVITSFKRGQRLRIGMFLAGACMTSPCQGPDQTCSTGGTCIPRRRAGVPENLRPDGGASDAAPGVDAPTDAPMGDAPIVPDAPIGIDAPDAPIGDDANNCTCPSDDNPCTLDFCMAGTCRHQPLDNRFGCPGGLCIDGACCTGCIDNMDRCQLGNNVLFCGSAARDCVVCNDQDACTQDGCLDGVCRTQPLSGPTCPTGVCVNGQCRCGDPGQPCCANGGCNEGKACMNGTCDSCGAEGQGCCSNNSCAPGLLCDSGKCSKCGEVGQPCCNDGCRVGVCIGATRTCQPCGGMGQPCCTTGDACGVNLACLNGTCGCGGQGQPCCGGTTCASDNNACNGVEMCTNGACGRSPPVTCTAASQCHMVGVCDPVSGRCSTPIRPNGSPCNDGNACSVGDTCRERRLRGDGRDDSATTTIPVPMTSACRASAARSRRSKGKSCVPPGDECRADICNEFGACSSRPRKRKRPLPASQRAVAFCQEWRLLPILRCGACISPILTQAAQTG